jgi:nitrogen fixation protein FixH
MTSLPAPETVMKTVARRRTSSWIPWAFVGGLGFVAAVNLVLVYAALSSAPGPAAARPFDEGNGYNKVLAQAARQDALGWTAETAFQPIDASGAARPAGELRVRLRDREGNPIGGAAIEAQLQRPVGPPESFDLHLAERPDGTYAAPVESLRAGQWDVRILARRGADIIEDVSRVVAE